MFLLDLPLPESECELVFAYIGSSFDSRPLEPGPTLGGVSYGTSCISGRHRECVQSAHTESHILGQPLHKVHTMSFKRKCQLQFVAKIRAVLKHQTNYRWAITPSGQDFKVHQFHSRYQWA